MTLLTSTILQIYHQRKTHGRIGQLQLLILQPVSSNKFNWITDWAKG